MVSGDAVIWRRNVKIGAWIHTGELVVPESDNDRYREVMRGFVALIRRMNADYGGRIQAL